MVNIQANTIRLSLTAIIPIIQVQPRIGNNITVALMRFLLYVHIHIQYGHVYKTYMLLYAKVCTQPQVHTIHTSDKYHIIVRLFGRVNVWQIAKLKEKVWRIDRF